MVQGARKVWIPPRDYPWARLPAEHLLGLGVRVHLVCPAWVALEQLCPALAVAVQACLALAAAAALAVQRPEHLIPPS